MLATFVSATCVFAAPPGAKPAPQPRTTYLDYAQKGHTAFDARDFKTALDLFNKSSELNPAYTDAALYAGMSLMELDRCPEAMKKFDKVIQTSKDKNETALARDKRNECDPAMVPEDAFEQAEKLMDDKKYAEASAMYKRILRAEPDNLRAMLFLGRGLCMSGSAERGREALKSVLERSRKTFEIENARNFLDTCESKESAFTKGAAAFKEKDYERAAGLFERVLEEEPGNTKAALYLGRSYCLTDRFEEGREKLEAAAAKSTDISDNELADAWLKSCKKSAELEAAEPAKAVGGNICLGGKVTDLWGVEAAKRGWVNGWHEGANLATLTDGNTGTGVSSGFGNWGDDGEGMTLDVAKALAAASENGGEGIPCASVELDTPAEMAKFMISRPAQNGEGEGGGVMSVSLWGSEDGDKWTRLTDPFVLSPGATVDLSGKAIKARIKARYVRIDMHSLGLYKWGKKTNSQMGLSELECYKAAAED